MLKMLRVVLLSCVVALCVGQQFKCPGDGHFAYPGDCNKYYQCYNGVAYQFSCSSGLHFNAALSTCDWSSNANCGSATQSTSGTTAGSTRSTASTATTKTSTLSTLITRSTTTSMKSTSASGGVLRGYWMWSWTGSSSVPPQDTTLSVCFNGWTTTDQAVNSCLAAKDRLVGKKYISYGGGNDNGRFTAANLQDITNGINSGKLSGYDGIVYDIENGDSGLASAFSASFAAAKAKGMGVIVTVSHSTPYGVDDGAALMNAFFKDANIDIISPQLYTGGSETSNDYTENGVSWSAYASAKAKIAPAVVLGSRDYPTALNYFKNKNVNIIGYIQWQQ